jgi:transposase
MIQGNFLTPKQREELEHIVKQPTESHGVGRRCNAILLLDDGMSCEQVAKVLYIDDDTVRTWYGQYQVGGFDRLETFDWVGGKPRLERRQEAALSLFLNANLHANTLQVRAYIWKTYHQQFSRSGCIKLMHRLGFEYRKPPRIPAQADEQKQQDFIDNYEALNKTCPKEQPCYFLDAVHPEYQSHPAFGWFKKGEKIALKSASGRKRVNIHGALNLENFDCPFVEPETVNFESTIALFEKIEARNPAAKHIHVFLDNARYHHARVVRQWMEKTKSRIKLHFLPPYAPHLNPIERLWGVMHQYVTHNMFYEKFNDFADAILAFFKKTVPMHWHDFRDQVTDNFRIISFKNFRVLG